MNPQVEEHLSRSYTTPSRVMGHSGEPGGSYWIQHPPAQCTWNASLASGDVWESIRLSSAPPWLPQMSSAL